MRLKTREYRGIRKECEGISNTEEYEGIRTNTDEQEGIHTPAGWLATPANQPASNSTQFNVIELD